MASAIGAACSSAVAVPAYSARCSLENPATTSANGSTFNQVSQAKFPLSLSMPTLCGANFGERAIASDSIQHVLDPSLKFANVMWFRGAYNAQIFVSEDEPADSVVRRFRKVVMLAGVIPECRRRRFFETPQDIVKRKQQSAQRRNKSRRFTPRPETFGPGGEKKEAGTAAAEDDDFWGFAEEGSMYL